MVKNKIRILLDKFHITRFIYGYLKCIKFIVKNKEIFKKENTKISYFYCVIDYAHYYSKNMIEENEYFFLYKFYKYRKNEKNKFLTRRQFGEIERKLSKDIRDIFWNKEKFLKEFSNFVQRDWIDFDNCTEDDIIKFISKNNKIIIKPKCDSLGNGIEIIDIEKINDKKKFIQNYMNSKKIAEECIKGNKEIEEFHPNSLNTIRVLTFYNGKKFIPFGACLRMGNSNNIVDNGHAGGIFATIDVETGVIISKGISANGTEYIKHPYSEKMIVGFTIPQWKEILEICEKATKNIPNIKVAGWDIALTENGNIEIIEANHMPDIDIMQAPLKKGLKQEVKKCLKEMYNINIK